jgi:hypothetical protein
MGRYKMSYSKKIKRLFTQSNVTVNDQINERILENSFNALDKSQNLQPSQVESVIWRTIMRNPIFKIAVAAVIIIAVLLGVHYSGGSVDVAGVAWGGVLDKVEQIPTIIFDMTVEYAISENEKRVLFSKNYIASDYGTRSDIFYEGQLTGFKYMLPIEKVAYQIDLDRKEYVSIELSDEQAAIARDTDEPRKWLKNILSGDYTELGRATINGVVVEGIEEKKPQQMVDANSIMRLWVDVQTNLPVQVEVEMIGMAEGQMRQHRYVMENFEWNAEIDASVFVPEIPDDFTQIKR